MGGFDFTDTTNTDTGVTRSSFAADVSDPPGGYRFNIVGLDGLGNEITEHSNGSLVFTTTPVAFDGMDGFLDVSWEWHEFTAGVRVQVSPDGVTDWATVFEETNVASEDDTVALASGVYYRAQTFYPSWESAWSNVFLAP